MTIRRVLRARPTAAPRPVRSRPYAVPAGALTLALATVLAGCSGTDRGDAGDTSDSGDTGSSSAGSTTSSSPTPSSTGTPSPTGTTSGSPSPTSSLAPSSDLGEPAATRTGSVDGQPTSLAVYPLHRNGRTATLNLVMTVDPSATDGVSLYDRFGDKNDAAASRQSAQSVDGIKLVDGTRGKLYLVASDGDGNCLCTDNFFGVAAKPGTQVAMTATFAAPPSTTTQVDVIVPQYGTVTGVPVE